MVDSYGENNNSIELRNNISSINHSLKEGTLEDSGCSLTVRDVSDLLKAQYAIITGGRSREGCPIITFPDKGNFNQLSDEEYRKLIIYITSIPPLQDADLGFVMIIDRRNDKWHSVKAVLLKLSGFFPGLIASVYVLRPVGFLQKAIAEVTSKIFRDEFKFRVVVCSCVIDLHDHIDRNQLSEDVGGCIPYDHEEWIDQRVAVEKFSANTQELSGALRRFTQRLQETEFPNDALSCEALHRDQSVVYTELKGDLISAANNGEALLVCIKTPSQMILNHLGPDKIINVTAVERLLVQLEETEATFDEFWSSHKTRLSECLQLRKFESDFKDLQPLLEDSIAQLAGMSETGDSVVRIDFLIAETQLFHQSCMGQLEKAEQIRLIGCDLIELQHYALDSIHPKCVELIRMRDTFHNLMTTRLHLLHKCRELQEKIEQANVWCTEGVKLLASQKIESYHTPELALDGLREIDDFMTSDICASDTANYLRCALDNVTSSDSKALIHQVVKRLDDVTLMCEKRRTSLRKLSSRLPRPVHAVTPEPAVPLHYVASSFSGAQCHHSYALSHSHPTSPLHSDVSKSPKMLRKAATLPKYLDESDTSECSYDPETAKILRGHVLKELLETERTYVVELCAVLKGYKDQMINSEMQPLIPINLYGKSDILFGNMEEIFRFHNDVFLRDLENCINTPELIGLCFVQRTETFNHLYSFYCQNKPQSEELRRQVGDNNMFFKECQRRLSHKLPLGAYLLKPVQRITKYQLLLKDLLKYVEESKDRRELQQAVDTMLNVLKCLNDSMHQVAISGFPGSITDLGRLLMQGPFCVWNESKKSIRDLRLKPAQRHLFLYEKVLMFTKRASKDTEKENYHYKNALKMLQIGLTESVRGNKGDIRKFEVWLQGRQEVYTILAPTSEVKDLWVKEIKKVLLDQFEHLKGENIKQYTSRLQKGASLNGIRVPPPLSPTSKHKSLRQTSSWETNISVSSSSSESGRVSNDTKDGSTRSKSSKTSDRTLGSADKNMGSVDRVYDEEEDSWSSEYSPSDEEDQTFSENTECSSSRFLVLADYNAMGKSEVSLRDGDNVELIKVGCAGWWYVRVAGSAFEGWAPAAYLERIIKKVNKSSPSISSQDSTSGGRPATSNRSSVTSLNKPEEST